MAAISDNRVAWQYHADNGSIYRVAAVDGYVTQLSGATPLQGGEAWAGVVGPRPSNFKMRRISVRDVVNGFSRVIPVYTVGAPICTAGTAITLNRLGNSFAYTSSGNPIPEEHVRKNVTTQST